jgi:hypothetical protein
MEKFEKHVLDDHSMKFIDYTTKHGSGALAEVHHSCQVQSDDKVCHLNVLWDEDSISNHLKINHNLSPTVYHNKFMNDYNSNLERKHKEKQQK